MSIDVKYCGHCNIDHPLTLQYWYKNGGVLYKCKRYYTLYEYKRSCIDKLNFKFNNRSRYHDALSQTLYKYIRKKLRLNAFWEVVMYDKLRADIVIPDLMIIIEVKTGYENISSVYAHRLKYRRLFPEYTVLMVSKCGKFEYTPKKVINKLKSYIT